MNASLVYLVLLRLLLATWYWYLTYVVDPTLRAYVTLVQFAFIALLSVMQIPILNHSYHQLQYPLPQILHALCYLEIALLSALPDLTYLLLVCYLAIMIFGFLALVYEPFEFYTTGCWSFISYFLHGCCIFIQYWRLCSEPILNYVILLCVFLSLVHLFSLRFVIAYHEKTWQFYLSFTARLCAFVTLLLFACLDELRHSATIVIAPVLILLMMIDCYYIHYDYDLDMFQEIEMRTHRSTIVTGLIYACVRVYFAVILLLETDLFRYNTYLVVFVAMMHVSQSLHGVGTSTLDCVLFCEYLSLMMKFNPFLWSTVLLVPFLCCCNDEQRPYGTYFFLTLVIFCLTANMSQDLGETNRIALILLYPLLLMSTLRFPIHKYHPAWWTIYGLCVVGVMLLKAYVVEELYLTCVWFALISFLVSLLFTNVAYEEFA